MGENICEKCGKEYSRGEKFCGVCGGRVVVKKKENPFRKHKNPILLVALFLAIAVIGLLLRGSPTTHVPDKRDSSSNLTTGTASESLQNTTEKGNRNDEIQQYVFKEFRKYPVIGSDASDGFWAVADYPGQKTENGAVWVAFDSDFNYLYSLDAENYTIYSGIHKGYSYGIDQVINRHVILDKYGNDVSLRFVDGTPEEEIVGLSEDDTGVTVWTYEVKDTYQDHVATINARDIDGNLKHSWEVEATIYDCYSMKQYNGSTYALNRTVMNINTGESFTLERSGIPYAISGVDEEGNVFISHEEGTLKTLQKCTPNGNKLWKIVLRGDRDVGRYSEGLIYVRGRLDDTDTVLNGFLDTNGNYVMDIDLTRISYLPAFHNGYALIECQNNAEVRFATLLDKQGNMLFEPIQAQVAWQDTEQRLVDYPIWTDNGTERLNPDGSTTCLLTVDLKYSDCLTRCGEDYYRIENGKIFADVALKEELENADP